MRNLGGAIGLAVINTELTERVDLHMARLGEALTAARYGVTETLAGLAHHLTPSLGSHAESGALAVLYRLTQREATVMAFSDVLLMMALVFVLGFLFMPLMRKVDPGAGGDAH
jgi:DHA2 family multidrug resistance protein